MTKTQTDTECGTCQDTGMMDCPTCQAGTAVPTNVNRQYGWCADCEDAASYTKPGAITIPCFCTGNELV